MPSNYGGHKLTLLFGANYTLSDGSLRGHRLAVEAGTPSYRNLSPQIETDRTLTVGWRSAILMAAALRSN